MTKSIRNTKDHGVDRRQILRLLGLGAVTATAASLATGGPAQATPESANKHLQKMSGTSSYKDGGIKLKLPEIAENGAVVPLTVKVDSPMTSGNYVKAIHVVADKNPNPQVATFHLTPAMGRAQVSTRLRLAKTQNIIAVAVMSDGSVHRASRKVKVTIGGCGG
jgi:sulfur-oxidizing protein SoxY|nr:thiosulfate oxidation carrier protein SoxY [Rhodospirillaceae bacterium]MDP6429714.1 thiosulfate oxidation carrier protein SoxY [Rhodospirillales bacterium]MDP6646370.1 thiosulfate oxidation carrier protein SoxY [Rhodospirillales bacterium]|tara:strand:+ start:363 stop:854 length:492 start_codon:yes stop_codon:yes gene_type:complete